MTALTYLRFAALAAASAAAAVAGPAMGADAPAPVVRQVEAPAAAPAATAAATPPPAAAGARAPAAGDITRALLAAQADGRRAAPERPMLGDTASAAYKRYVDSFTHPIPEFFEDRVQTENGNP